MSKEGHVIPLLFHSNSFSNKLVSMQLVYCITNHTCIVVGGPFIMAKQKKPVHRVQMTEGKRNITWKNTTFRPLKISRMP